MTRLRDLGRWSGGNTPSKANIEYWTNGTVPWVSPKDMKFDEITRSEDLISQSALTEGRASLLPTGSVLIVTRSGILSHTLPVAVTKLPVTINQDIKALTLNTGVSAKYVAHALRGSSQRILRQCAKHGTTVASVDTNALLDFEIPMVGFNEQEAVVAELEKQLSRLDEAVANLQRVKANLKRYKASVLKTAVEGRLVETEATLARREGRTYETGEQLLQRILEERRAKWVGRGKYKEPDMPDATSVLPEGWTWAYLDTVCSKITDGTHHSPVSFPEGEFKYVTSKNVREFRLDFSDISYVSAGVHEEIYARCDVRYGDVLYVKDGANTGLAAVNTLVEPFSLLSSVGVFRPLEVVDPRYMVAYLNCSHVRDEMLANIAGVAITRLTLTKLKVSRIAVPPRSEQVRIVAEVDRHLSIIREVETEVDANLQRAQSLRQATLAKAFLP